MRQFAKYVIKYSRVISNKTGKLKRKTIEWSSQTRRKWRYWKNKLKASKGGAKQKKKTNKKDKEEFSATQWKRE
eukprot:10161838-Karenia_brevis.AAC.1